MKAVLHGIVKTRNFLFLPDEGFDQRHAADVFLDDGGGGGQLVLDFTRQVFEFSAEGFGEQHHDRGQHQNHERQLPVHDDYNNDTADQADRLLEKGGGYVGDHAFDSRHVVGHA